MEIDPKCFFENPPRMKEDLKDYIKNLSEQIVTKILCFCDKLFPNERLNSKHIKLAILAMSVEPVTAYNRNGLCVQNVKLKPISKILCKSIDSGVTFMSENKYGNTDKKIYKGCLKLIKNIKHNSTAVIALSVSVSQICGILMQSSLENSCASKTLTLESVKENGIKHKSTNGCTLPYSSLIRFLNVVEFFEPRTVTMIDVTKKKKDVKTKLESLEIKPKVSFKDNRPSTPEHCFWED